MAPREALSSYPDHYITTDYYEAPTGMEGGGVGFDNLVQPPVPPENNFAFTGFTTNNFPPNGTTMTNGNTEQGMQTPPHAATTNNVENDPLSLSESHIMENANFLGNDESVANTTNGGTTAADHSPSTMAVGTTGSFGGGGRFGTTTSHGTMPVPPPDVAGVARASVVTPSVSRSNSVASTLTNPVAVATAQGVAATRVYQRSVSSLTVSTDLPASLLSSIQDQDGPLTPNEVTPEATEAAVAAASANEVSPDETQDSIDTMDKYAALLTLDLNEDGGDKIDGTSSAAPLNATLTTTSSSSPVTEPGSPGVMLAPRPAPYSSPGSIARNEAFELSPGSPPSQPAATTSDNNTPGLNFDSSTTISDLTYYAERGAIVDVLASLHDSHLKTLGTRMLADYAKMPHRRVAVASNTKILEFILSTVLEMGEDYVSSSWMGREYAVETVRSLTAAEENDRYLMNARGLLPMLALVARGGPFVKRVERYGREMYVAVPPPGMGEDSSGIIGTASDKARLHACIAVMNLSCGKSNKVEITNVSEVLEAMRDVMRGRYFASRTSVVEEARLKATTCIKNLSNADANDAALLGTPGLVETLGMVAEATCRPEGATTCTTHACLALMNLSISKANKNRVFRTPGVMDALMAVITRTASSHGGNSKDPSFEARVKACSALSNLAIGYDNKIPMFHYPGFVESILTVIRTDNAEARTKACSILWSFAAEMKNQVPVVQRGDILPALVAVAKEDTTTEARFKCVAALTLLAESPENAVPLLHSGSLEPLMNVLQEAGPDPTQWKGQTASWCVGFLMNMAQCDDVVPALLSEGIVDLLAPLLALDHYQSLKAAMAVTFVCKYDTGDKTYNLLRQTENVIPKIVGLLHNTLSGRGGSGYKYGVFTLRSSVGCIASLASGPDFMKERIATGPVFESLLRVVSDFCVDGGTPGAIVGGGKDDSRSSILAVRALSLLIGHLIPEPGCAAMPFGPVMDDQLITALRSFELSMHRDIDDETRQMAHSARIRIEGGKNLAAEHNSVSSGSLPGDDLVEDDGIGLSLASKCFPFTCGMNLHALPESSSGDFTYALPTQAMPPTTTPVHEKQDPMEISDDAASAASGSTADSNAVRTFLLTDAKTGRRFAVPCEPSGGRAFNDNRVWCFRRGRWCREGEQPDASFQWSDELQLAYTKAISEQGNISPTSSQL